MGITKLAEKVISHLGFPKDAYRVVSKVYE